MPIGPEPIVSGYYPPVANHPLWYLGTVIPDPQTPAAPYGLEKVPGYDPALTYFKVVKTINSGHDMECQSKSIIVLLFVLINSPFFEIQVSSILLLLDVFKMDALCDYAIAKTGKSLQDLIEKNTLPGGSFR